MFQTFEVQKCGAERHLQDVIAVGVQRRLRQFHCEHTVGAAGLTVELSVGYPPFLLS